MASTPKIENATTVFKSHVNNIKTQCDQITQDICTELKTNDIDSVKPSDIKDCFKLKKDIISDYLLSLLNLSKSLYQCDYVCKYSNQSDVSIKSSMSDYTMLSIQIIKSCLILLTINFVI